jgi:hypothetical protein
LWVSTSAGAVKAGFGASISGSSSSWSLVRRKYDEAGMDELA